MSLLFLGLLQRLPTPIKSRLRALRRGIGGSPIQQVFAELERRGTPVRQSRVLEVFGGNGDLHVKDYAPRVGALEVWELDHSFEPRLRRNVPTALIRIGDAFQLIKQTSYCYDIVVVDNPVSMSATPLELCVDLLAKVTAEPVFIFNVIPDLRPSVRRRWPALRHLTDVETLLQRRRVMFNTDTPEHVPLERMTRAYVELARPRGFELDWSFTKRRHYGDYLVLKLRPAAEPTRAVSP